MLFKPQVQEVKLEKNDDCPEQRETYNTLLFIIIIKVYKFNKFWEQI